MELKNLNGTFHFPFIYENVQHEFIGSWTSLPAKLNDRGQDSFVITFYAMNPERGPANFRLLPQRYSATMLQDDSDTWRIGHMKNQVFQKDEREYFQNFKDFILSEYSVTQTLNENRDDDAFFF